MEMIIGWLVAEFILKDALQKLAHAAEIFLFCFLLISLGGLGVFLLLERDRLATPKRWVVLILVLAHVVLYLGSAASFMSMLGAVDFESPAAYIGLFSIPPIGIFVAYVLARKRFAPSDLRSRFVLIPLASVSLGTFGAWLSLAVTFCVLQLEG